MSNLLVQNIKHTNGTTAISVDSSGRVSRSLIPSFKAYKASSGNVTYGAGAVISADFDSTNFNVGNHFSTSTGLFTAPIAGLYLFGISLFNNTTSGSKRVSLFDNTGHAFGGQGASSNGNDFVMSAITQLSVGNTVDVRSAYADTIIFQGVGHSYFWGYFIG
jgi:hypothetical protein